MIPSTFSKKLSVDVLRQCLKKHKQEYFFHRLVFSGQQMKNLGTEVRLQ
jgi:hypothetical protein